MLEALVRGRVRCAGICTCIVWPTLSSSDVLHKTRHGFKQTKNNALLCHARCMCGAFALCAVPVVRTSRFECFPGWVTSPGATRLGVLPRYTIVKVSNQLVLLYCERLDRSPHTQHFANNSNRMQHGQATLLVRLHGTLGCHPLPGSRAPGCWAVQQGCSPWASWHLISSTTTDPLRGCSQDAALRQEEGC